MKLAILDDDRDHNAYLNRLFGEAGHICECFDNAHAFIRFLQRETADLLVLDWTLPASSGLEVLAWARTNLPAGLPVLMVTSRAGDEDTLTGFAAGADDYVAKPVQPAILRARVEALLRRAYPPPAAEGPEIFEPYEFDLHRQTVRVGEETVTLTAKEFQLALTLFRNLSRALSRGYLLEAVWGKNPDLETRTLDAHISRIRLKLNLRPQNGFRLSTVYSYGYRLEPVGAEEHSE
jgi:DNA-binding response OmpR family regulator